MSLLKKLLITSLSVTLILITGYLPLGNSAESDSVEWVPVNNGLYGGTIRSLVIDPSNTQVVYAGTFGGGVFKSTDGGSSWTAKNNGLTNTYVYSLAIDSSNTNVLYAGTNGGGVFKSTDGGSSWSVKNGVLKNTYVHCFVIDPSNTQVIYAGTDGGGVFKSTDGGTSWSAVNSGLTNSSVYSLAIDPTNTQTIYAGTHSGVFKSTNGGTSWSTVNSGLTNLYVHSLAIDPTNTQVVYAGTGGGGGVFKSTDGGSSWSVKNTVLTNNRVYSLVIDPSNNQVVYAGTFYGVFKTTDGGSSWSGKNNGLTNTNVYSLVIDPSNNQVVYAGTFYGVFKTFPMNYTITASATSGGSISPSGTITVNYGDSKTFTITPSSGYKISNVKIDGVSKGSISSYTFSNITSNHTIEATFEKEITQIVIVLQIGNKNFTVNGASNTLDSPPVIKNSRTLLPIRAVIESLGGTVGWDATERKVTVTLGSTTIELWIGKSIAEVNGVDTPIDKDNPKVVPEIINSRTMLPLRFVTENLGCDVKWEGTTKTITITYQGR